MGRRSALIVAVIGILGLLAAACGGKSETGTRSGGVSDHGTRDVSGAGETAKFTLELNDRYFAPTFLKAKPGQRIDVGLGNEGQLTHTFTISSLGVDVVLQPGEKKNLQFALPQSTDVEFLCRFHGSQGMRGKFFFDAAPAPGGETPSEDRYGYG